MGRQRKVAAVAADRMRMISLVTVQKPSLPDMLEKHF